MSVVALLSVDSVLYTPPDQREKAMAAREKFSSPEGDHITLLNIYRGYRSAKGNKVREVEMQTPLWAFAWGSVRHTVMHMEVTQTHCVQ